LATALNITTTTEEVQTLDRLDWLRAKGYNEVQGFLVSTAKPAADIEQLLLRFGRAMRVAKALAPSLLRRQTALQRPVS
jgi:EAL domain-containing protein (putative c-di-GMP-specific phosphodiesterase class I)